MTQQMGSASGTAPVARETEAMTEVAPGGASELMSESMTDGGASGDAARPGPGSVGHTVGAESADGSPNGSADGSADSRAARMRGWLRRTPPAAAYVAPIAPSVVAAGPELDLASNDPLIGYLLSAASAVDITRRALLSPALDALQTLTFRRNKRRT